MTTKNAKRLWPVPVTLGVMAMAALLAFGLLAANGAQPAAAQSADPCVNVTAGGVATDPMAVLHTPGTEDRITIDLDTNIIGCYSSSSEAIIELAGYEKTGATEIANYVVYGTDVQGSSSAVYPPGTKFGNHDEDQNTSNVFYTGNVGGTGANATKEVFALAAVTISVGPATVNTSGKVTPSKGTMSVSGSPLSTGYVWVAQGIDFTAPIINSDVTVPKTGGEESAVLKSDRNLLLRIEFLGPPVHTAPDVVGGDDDTPDINTNREPISNLQIMIGSKTLNSIRTEDMLVKAIVQDEKGRDLKGKITYTVEFVEGSALAPGQQSSYTTRQMDYDADPDDPKGTTHPINGWATGTDPVRINVSATFTGGTGQITLPLVEVTANNDEIDEIVISRAGKLDRVDIVASCYAPSVDAGERVATKAEAKICGKGDDPDDIADKVVDMRPRTVFQAGQMFTLKANAVDILGTDTSKTIALDLPDVTTEEGANAFSAGASLDKLPDAADKTIVSIHEDAPPGKYDLTVKTSDGVGSDRIDRETTIAIIVSGDPETYTVSGPKYIALTSFASGEYTVTAADTQGNPPNFGEDEDMVSVAVESDLDVRVTGLDSNDMVTLDEETGMATFSLYKPASAQEGDTASIGIFVDGELMDQITVMFSEAGVTTPEPMPEGEMMTLATDVLGSYLAAVNTFGVTWTPAADAQQQYVVLASLADGYSVVDVNVLGADASSHEFTVEDAAGDYEIFVATYIDGEFYYDDSTATMVTVE